MSGYKTIPSMVSGGPALVKRPLMEIIGNVLAMALAMAMFGVVLFLVAVALL